MEQQSTSATDKHMTPGRRITAEVTAWQGVIAGYGKRGEFAFKVDGREIGHLHGDTAAHFFFEPKLWDELRSAGRIGPHPIFPHRVGPAARRIAGEDDVNDVIALMRLNYERVVGRRDNAA